MIETSVLAVFIPTFFFVSITPGMCMTLALTLGMTVGLKRTFWMMYGELLGVAVVSISAVVGVSAIMLAYPTIFVALKIAGASYLAWIAFNLWRNQGKLALSESNDVKSEVSGSSLFYQGFVTAIANPKGWAFMVSLLPPFIDPELSVPMQVFWLVGIILMSELVCMILYATGGRSLVRYLAVSQNVKLVNRISATLMFGVAVWLLVG